MSGLLINPETVERVVRDQRQVVTLEWAVRTFSVVEPGAGGVAVRARRFLEEALELAQAVGVTFEESDKLQAYVYGRPAGVPFQELGGVMVTANCLAEVLGHSLTRAERAETARVFAKSAAHFQARDLAKVEAGL